MLKDEMLKLLHEGVDPIEISIQKWRDVIYGTGPECGAWNCALCEKFMYTSDEFCKFCPVKQKTGTTSCKDTPYVEFVDHIKECPVCNRGSAREESAVLCNIGYELGKKELYFLQSLLPTSLPESKESIRDKLMRELENNIDQIEDESYKEGYDNGVDDSDMDASYDAGYDDGSADGFDDGYKRGHDEGYVDGCNDTKSAWGIK